MKTISGMNIDENLLLPPGRRFIMSVQKKLSLKKEIILL